MLEVLEKTLGVVTHACKEVGICRYTFYKWLKDDKEFADKVNGIQEVAIDYVESQLYKSIRDGNVSAIIFFMKTKAKHRGYQENYDVTSGGEKINVTIEDGRNKRS